MQKLKTFENVTVMSCMEGTADKVNHLVIDRKEKWVTEVVLRSSIQLEVSFTILRLLNKFPKNVDVK